MPRRFALLGFPFLAVVALAPASDSPPKPEDFVTVQKGTLPIILSAPHGGRKKVPDVPQRAGKGLTNFHTVRDNNTIELTEKLAAGLEESLDGKPWVVIAHFDRKYLDANRPPEEGYESDQAKPYYGAYHDALATACKTVRKKHGRGLLLDIHGNGVHPGAICRGTLNGKSVSLLREREGWPAVRGKYSVLGRMEKLGYKVLPPSDANADAKEERQFTGGHIVSNYGSHTAHAIDAIQLEFGTHLRDKDKYETTAKDLADAVRVFHDTYLKDGK